MRVRSTLPAIAGLLALSVSSASAATISYTINFAGGGSGLASIGPGSFSFDTGGQSGVIGPPATLTNFMVPAVLSGFQASIPLFPVFFTQASPGDDFVIAGRDGIITAVNLNAVDSNADNLFLNSDNTWFLPLSPAQPSIEQSGTYTITASIAAVPEPATITLTATAFATLLLLRRRITS